MAEHIELSFLQWGLRIGRGYIIGLLKGGLRLVNVSQFLVT